MNLTVSSAYGTPAPAAGANALAAGAVVTGWVGGSPVTAGTTQYLCRGWLGSGSAPAAGTTASTAPFAVTNASTLTWLWLTNYWVALGTNGCGTVAPASAWQRFGTNVAVTAAAAPRFYFNGWQGDGSGRSMGPRFPCPTRRPIKRLILNPKGKSPVAASRS